MLKRFWVSLGLVAFIGVASVAGTMVVSPAHAAENDVVDTIEVGTNPYGVAVSPDGDRVYVTNFGAATVSVIDTTTSPNTVTGVTVEGGPTGVAVSPDGDRVYVTNYLSDTVSVINTSTNTVTDTVAVGTNPFGVAVSPDGDRVYVTNFGGNTVSVIDTTATPNTVTSVTVGTDPFGVAVSPDGDRVYVTNYLSDTVSVINTSTNTVTDTVAVGTNPYGVAVSPDGDRVYVTNNGDGTVSVIEGVTTSSPSPTQSTTTSGSPGIPGIFLAVNPVLVGKSVEGSPAYCGAASIQPNSTYTLSVQSVTNSALTRTVLASGTVSSRGHLDERVLLGALNPGSYKIVMTGIHASGYQLVLTNYLTVGANGSIVSVSAESQQPFLN